MPSWPIDGHPLLAFILSAAVAFGLVPMLVKAAHWLNLLDHPHGWKSHERATPYMGGVAVCVAFAIGVLAFGSTAPGVEFFIVGSFLCCGVGLLDDRYQLRALGRVVFEGLLGAGLWAADLGWEVFDSDSANLLLTMVWTIGVINAVNLLDLMDGVATEVTVAATVGLITVALIDGDPGLAAVSAALAGGCLGYLPANLARPPRLFLGDAGTMTLGFLLSAIIMSSHLGPRAEIGPLLGSLFVAVPLIDMGLRIVSRLKRGAPLLLGASDSVANGLRTWLNSSPRVALVLGLTQLMLGGLAIILRGLGDTSVVVVVLAGLASIAAVGGLFVPALWGLPDRLRAIVARGAA